MDKRYKIVGDIANSSKGKIQGMELALVLGTKGRGCFNIIRAAYYAYYNIGDSQTAERIAQVFTKKDGTYAY